MLSKNYKSMINSLIPVPDYLNGLNGLNHMKQLICYLS